MHKSWGTSRLGTLWEAFVVGAAVPILLYWGTQGISAWVKARQARRAELAEDERKAAEQHEAHVLQRAERAEREVRWLRRRVRQLDDYAQQLRADYATETGKVPRPWPELEGEGERYG